MNVDNVFMLKDKIWYNFIMKYLRATFHYDINAWLEIGIPIPNEALISWKVCKKKKK